MTPKVNKESKIVIIGAGSFGVSSAYHLAKAGYKDVTIIDRQPYDTNFYDSVSDSSDSASSDLNKIIRFSHYNEDYQELAMKTILEWEKWNEMLADAGDLPEGLSNDYPLYVKSGYTRYYTEDFSNNEEEISNSESFKRVGLESTQFELSDKKDVFRARCMGFSHKLDPLKLADRVDQQGNKIKSHLDVTAGFAYASRATYFCFHLAKKLGVKHIFGPEKGQLSHYIREGNKIKGVVTKDGSLHSSNVVIIACGAWSPSLVPQLESINQATSGNIIVIKIPEDRKDLINKYSIQKFPVVAWKSYSQRDEGGGVFFFPITEPEPYLKFGARHTKWTNPVTRGDKSISIPLTESTKPSSNEIPSDALGTVKDFISTYLPDVADLPITKTRLCWYSESVNDDFIIDWVPHSEGLFSCGGSSTHGFKFLPTVGQLTVEALEGISDKYTKRFSWREPSSEDVKEFESTIRNFDINSIDRSHC